MSYFNENELNSSESSGKSIYLSKGINANVVIGPITATTPDTGSPYLSIVLYKDNATLEQGTTFKLYMSENARKASLKKISHLAKKIISKEALLEINNASTSLDDFAANLSAAITDSTIRWFKLCAEQYMNANNEIKDRLTIGLPDFASQDENHNLKWDSENKYDYRKLETANVTNDLPL